MTAIRGNEIQESRWREAMDEETKIQRDETGEKNEKGNEIILYLFRQCCIFGIYKEKKKFFAGPLHVVSSR